jgi:hypothetical protein
VKYSYFLSILKYEGEAEGKWGGGEKQLVRSIVFKKGQGRRKKWEKGREEGEEMK